MNISMDFTVTGWLIEGLFTNGTSDVVKMTWLLPLLKFRKSLKFLHPFFLFKNQEFALIWLFYMVVITF